MFNSWQNRGIDCILFKYIAAWKRFFKFLFGNTRISVLTLCVCSCLTFVGCNNVKWSKTTNDTSKVVSNGGTTVYHDGWLYFINGTKDVNEANNTGSTIRAGIYRAEADENGNVLYKETPAVQEESSDKEVKKEYKKVEPVVKSLTGFANGSLHIFGDYLYYVTPSKGINDEGDMLTGKLSFNRYDLVAKHSQHLFTTSASDDTVSYTYYKQNADLYLVIYEKNSQTLTSLKMGDEVNTAFVKEEVVSVLFSNTNGSVEGLNNVTDCYMYYTMNAEKNKDGNRVFRNLPNGSDEKLISENHSVSLVTVQKGYLVYQKDSLTYAEKITNTTSQLSFNLANIVYYGSYTNVIYVEENNKLGAIIYDNGVIRKIVWDATKSLEENVESMQPIFDDYESDDKVKFIGLDGNYLVYQLSNYIYKVKVLNIAAGDEVREIKLSTTKMDEAKDNSLISLEIVNGYVYGMYTETDHDVTYMYRVRIQTPKEAGETDKDGNPKDIEAAEFIGVKE